MSQEKRSEKRKKIKIMEEKYICGLEGMSEEHSESFLPQPPIETDRVGDE
jgi:hypothetical protein